MYLEIIYVLEEWQNPSMLYAQNFKTQEVCTGPGGNASAQNKLYETHGQLCEQHECTTYINQTVSILVTTLTTS